MSRVAAVTRRSFLVGLGLATGGLAVGLFADDASADEPSGQAGPGPRASSQSEENLIGGLNNGWAVANTTLAYERSGLGAGAGATAALANPGTVAGDLPKRAGDFVTKARTPGAGGGGAMAAGSQRLFTDLATTNGAIPDAFWRMTPRELAAAIEALMPPRAAALDRTSFEVLMRRFPDNGMVHG